MTKRIFINFILVFLVFTICAEARSLKDIKHSGEIRICVAGSANEYYKKMGLVFARWLYF